MAGPLAPGDRVWPTEDWIERVQGVQGEKTWRAVYVVIALALPLGDGDLQDRVPVEFEHPPTWRIDGTWFSVPRHMLIRLPPSLSATDVEAWLAD